MTGNGQPPAGFRSPIRQALTHRQIVAGVPRALGGMLLMFCVGLGLLLESWGAVGVFFMFYGIMCYLTKRDPWWPEVWRDYVSLWLATHPFEAILIRNAIIISTIGLLIGLFLL